MAAPRIACLVAVAAVTTWSCSGNVADISIAPGDVVRVTAPSMDLHESVGSVTALESDRLTVQIAEPADAVAVPFADLTKIEVRRGKKSRLGTGALIGGGVGAALGIALAAGCSGHEVLCEGGSEYVIYVPAAAALGAGLGALVGSLIKVDRWEAVALDELRVGPSSANADGIEVSVTLRL